MLVVACGLAGLIPDGADGKPRRADLAVPKVSLSAGPSLGATVTLRAVVRNAGKASAKPSQLSVGLAGMRSPLARKQVGRLKRGKKTTVSLPIRFPSVIAPGRYAIAVCADAAKKIKERKEGNNCRTAAQRLTVDSVVPVPVAPGGTTPPIQLPGPPGLPAPTATATATATPASRPACRRRPPSEEAPRRAISPSAARTSVRVMEKDWLEARLAEGRSIESIAKEVGKHPSTIGYWVKHHGLRSPHADRRAARGGLDRERLERLVQQGLSTRRIAQEVGRSQGTVRHWLKQHGLRTQQARSEGPQPDEVLRTCATHGEAVFVRYGETDHYRCLRCRRERVIARRRKVKQILVAEAGGCCAVCGYAGYAGALQFHHRDPASKRFGLALNGVARSIARAREEAAKCVLLCANCHAEVEAGVTGLPLSPSRTAAG